MTVYTYDAIKAHCCIKVTGNKELLNIIEAAGVHNESISRTFRSEDLSQLVKLTRLKKNN